VRYWTWLNPKSKYGKGAIMVMELIGYIMAFWEFIQSWIFPLIWTIIGVVIGELAVFSYLEARKRPKIVIGILKKENKLGFCVSVEKRTIKDARVRCNGINYPWENGTNIERKDLYVGDNPSSFFPYQVSAEFIDDVSKVTRWSIRENEKSGGVSIAVKEIITQKIVFNSVCQIPKDATLMHVFADYAETPAFIASIRIIGEGIEETRDYPLRVGLKGLTIGAIKEGKPLMDYVTYGFELKK